MMNILCNRYTTTAHRIFPAAITLVLGANSFQKLMISKTNSSPSSIPSRFGQSIQQQRSYSNTNFPDDIHQRNKDDNNGDCPICKKYSQGPCGEMFVKWLACTDKHRGSKDDDDEHRISIMCQSLAEPLTECLQKEAKYYASLDIYTDEENDDDIEDLRQAWITVIQEVEECHQTTKDFPSPPIMDIRPQDRTGMAGFDYKLPENKMTIVLAYIRDNDTGELLAAGSIEDLWEYNVSTNNKKGILRLSFGPECKSVTAYALYQSDNDDENNDSGKSNDILYKYGIHLSSS